MNYEMPRSNTGHVLFSDIVGCYKRLFIYFVAAAVSVTCAIAKPTAFTEARIPTRHRSVRLDLYRPNDPSSRGYDATDQQPRPTILLLYGAGGLAFDGSRMRVTAQRFVSAGYNVYLLHYFDQTRASFTEPWIIRKDFDEWVDTVRDAIEWIHNQPSSSGQGSGATSAAKLTHRAAIAAATQARYPQSGIGLYGYSLGGFIALEAASDNPQVGAIVDFAGGWQSAMKPLGRMPPLLLLNGQRDRWVPYNKYVEPLYRYLEQHHIPYQSRVFPKAGHKFKAAELEDVMLFKITIQR